MGGWNRDVHESGLQRNRQYRAYFILEDEPGEVSRSGDTWTIHGYRVTLHDCECMDFADRRLPCKHLYAAAIAAGAEVPLGRTEYREARRNGLEVVFDYRGT